MEEDEPLISSHAGGRQPASKPPSRSSGSGSPLATVFVLLTAAIFATVGFAVFSIHRNIKTNGIREKISVVGRFFSGSFQDELLASRDANRRLRSDLTSVQQTIAALSSADVAVKQKLGSEQATAQTLSAKLDGIRTRMSEVATERTNLRRQVEAAEAKRNEAVAKRDQQLKETAALKAEAEEARKQEAAERDQVHALESREASEASELAKVKAAGQQLVDLLGIVGDQPMPPKLQEIREKPWGGAQR
mmetsp:Transcript_28888/g.69892  ORF Transcript_28888/g.69892 Transcript_28888/m.69892 type:complete len:248 (-) Transcript_28888:18-761(-)